MTSLTSEASPTMTSRSGATSPTGPVVTPFRPGGRSPIWWAALELIIAGLVSPTVTPEDLARLEDELGELPILDPRSFPLARQISRVRIVLAAKTQ
jgi:hypothetical protein